MLRELTPRFRPDRDRAFKFLQENRTPILPTEFRQQFQITNHLPSKRSSGTRSGKKQWSVTKTSARRSHETNYSPPVAYPKVLHEFNLEKLFRRRQ